MQLWFDIGFEIEITGDGSPSLRLLESVDPSKDRGESMHHSGGACAETLLIYGKPISEVLQKIQRPSFLVVGLGLGYIELTIAREALLLGKSATDVEKITSFESVEGLRRFFISWLWDRFTEISEEVRRTYDLVLDHLTQNTSLKKQDLKVFLRNHFHSLGNIQGAITSDIQIASQYHGILYDAFSSKTSPFLWEEDFLNQFLEQAAANSCVLSTYACKGSLKRALKRQGFEVFVREGFQGKRNSTLAYKQFNNL